MEFPSGPLPNFQPHRLGLSSVETSAPSNLD
eukprot:CAMPEP_0204275508 /NCGR_PEP_ID=MMETSP0468-20130131/26134_1 /ASSEMBLY_ACC=CAM_ASM_000383 /TAXON_ID=2969 /ORGANISM="Oxyrrhis marina" /LENGTH=30 /DNA_ID= /DNA_START= /DNA_END= /DNA_ORIENTATION=